MNSQDVNVPDPTPPLQPPIDTAPPEPAVLPVNAQDVNVPDPPLSIDTAPPCCFKIEQRMKENRFKTDFTRKKFHLKDVEIK